MINKTNDITFMNITTPSPRIQRHVADMNTEGWHLLQCFVADNHYTFVWQRWYKKEGESDE